MKGFAIQLMENGIDVLDLKIDVQRDSMGKIESGLCIGPTLEQNKALLLIAQPGEFKENATLGVGLSDALLGDDLLVYRHRIRKQFQKDGLNITQLDLYNSSKTKIEANY